MNITKSDIIQTISRESGIDRIETEIIINGFISEIQRALKNGNEVEIRGLGSFRIIDREPRKARNPKTGETIQLPKRKIPRIKPSKEIRKMLLDYGKKKDNEQQHTPTLTERI